MERQNEVLENVIIKFAGDSGDGMQLTGTQFTRLRRCCRRASGTDSHCRRSLEKLDFRHIMCVVCFGGLQA